MSKKDKSDVTFQSLGVMKEICDELEKLDWKKPTKIQEETIPLALKGQDIVGLAETGSGKTGAFVIPILQALLTKPTKLFALILTPTRDLAFQIAKHFDKLGGPFNVTWLVLVGGVSRNTQKEALKKRPNIIIATPGRLLHHLLNEPKFKLDRLKYLVLDEADKMLIGSLANYTTQALGYLPQDRTTFLFSATLPDEVQDLWEKSSKVPARVEVSANTRTVEKLKQCLAVIPERHKEDFLYTELRKLVSRGFGVIVFCNQWTTVVKLTMLLQRFNINVISLHGKDNQWERNDAIQKFKTEEDSVLIATNMASRGLDLRKVEVVINYDVPHNTEDYVHRVGRTARANSEGKSITIVTCESEAREVMKIEEDLEIDMEPTYKWEELEFQLVRADRQISEIKKEVEAEAKVCIKEKHDAKRKKQNQLRRPGKKARKK